jgi:hypothetical protein
VGDGASAAWLAAPLTLLALLGLATWSLVFAGGVDTVPPSLTAQSGGELDGVAAARAAIKLAREAVEGEHGLLGGPPESVSVRRDGGRLSAHWTVVIAGPVRLRPNTAEEFTTPHGDVVVQVSAHTGELSGEFSTGIGVVRYLGIGDEGFANVPLGLVWPPD